MESRHGIITQYTIHYKDVEKEKEGTMIVKAPVLRAIINGLRQQAEYTFWIFASTSKGNGPASNSEKATTAGRRSKKTALQQSDNSFSKSLTIYEDKTISQPPSRFGNVILIIITFGEHLL